jgi:hypothetical protein
VPDFKNICSIIVAQGWPKAAYVLCLLLLIRRAVSFQECLILLMVAVMLEILPSKKQEPSKTNTQKTEQFRQAGKKKM